MDKIKTFDEFIGESVESNKKEAELLASKEQLLAKKQQAVAAKNEKAITQIERSIAMLDSQIEQIRKTEELEKAKNETL
jgi:hypothetical protein